MLAKLIYKAVQENNFEELARLLALIPVQDLALYSAAIRLLEHRRAVLSS